MTSSEPASPAVEVTRLARAFGDRIVLRDISLAVAPGDSVAILGANGSGKTTLLRVLATLVAPSGGDARVHGVSVSAAPRRARAFLGWVPATDGGFFPRLTGRANLALFASLRRRGPADVERLARTLRSLSAFEAALDRPFHLCSSGMRQALALGRALLGEPRVLLMDEPTRSLDQESADGFRRFLRDGLDGRTLILATHSREEAALASRCVVIREGRLA